MAPQNKGGHELKKKKKTIKRYKGQFMDTQKIPCMLLYCY
jgi:hypothetical protein